MRDNNLSAVAASAPTAALDEHSQSSSYQRKYSHLSNTGKPSRGGGRKQANSVSGGSSVSSSDAALRVSGTSHSIRGKEDATGTGEQNYDAANPYHDKKRHDGKKRRKPKLRNKVEGGREKYDKSKPAPSNAPRKSAFGWNTTVCPASKGGPTSKKQHDAPMMKRDLYFSLHCDRVSIAGKKADGNSSNRTTPPPSPLSATKSDAVARVVLINWENETVLDTFVQVPVPVTDFYETGITAEDVGMNAPHAKSFASVRQIVESTLKGKILIGHQVEKHLMALGLTHPWTDTRDCASFFTGEGTEGAPRSLESLCKELLHRSLPPAGHEERPMQNCVTSMDLYKKMRKEWEEFLIAEARKKESELQEQTNDSPRQRTYSYSSSDQGSATPHSRLGSCDGINLNAVALHCSSVATRINTAALARVTVLNSFHQVLWDSFVQIHEPITDGGASGVLPQDVLPTHGAMPFSMVRQQLERLLRGTVIVGYHLNESLRLLDMSHHPSQLRDIAFFRPFMYAEMNGVSGAPVIVERSLEELSYEVLQKPLAAFGQSNRPLSTCSVVLELYELYQDQWERQMYEQRHQQACEAGMVHQFPGGSQQSRSTWFSWGKRQQPEDMPLQYQTQLQPHSGPGIASSSVALSAQAFEVLHGEAISTPVKGAGDERSRIEGCSYLEASSAHDGSSFYEPSLAARLDDSSRGILESFTAESVVSSIRDDASSAAGEYPRTKESQGSTSQKSSSWFRFGSKKIRYSSPSSRVSMTAVQEQAEEPPVLSLGTSAFQPFENGEPFCSSVEDNDDVPSAEDAPTSRSWFGFGRRSSSPSQLVVNASGNRRSRSRSPESPLSGPTVATNESDNEINEDGAASAVDAVEVVLSVSTTNNVASPLSEVQDTSIASDQNENSTSWFGFRRSKSHQHTSETDGSHLGMHSQLESVDETSSEPDVILTTTEKTDTTDDDWLQEVMSRSTGTGANEDLNSVGFSSLLESDAGFDEAETSKQSSKSSRGQSSWFGFKRSKSQKVSRLGAASENGLDGELAFQPPPHLPQSVSIDKKQAGALSDGSNTYQTKAPELGASWYLGSNSAVAPVRSGRGDDSILGRSRIPTEATVPTVSTEEEEDDSAGAFTEEFEKGVAQSFAYLEI